MQRIIFFSKSMHDEPPRIRHQLADLFLSRRHEVVFYQRPAFPFTKKGALINKKINGQLELRQTKQLVHHQLRVWYWLAWINAAYERCSISRSLGEVDESDVIINFNYDYFFLRKIFKTNIIITVINDDFVAQAKLFSGRHVDAALKKTGQLSDTVLTVSTPLLQQSRRHTDAAMLFLPWAANYYEKPNSTSNRRSVLLWAYIDKRVDFDLLRYLLDNNGEFTFYLVGPTDIVAKAQIENICNNYKNIIVLPSSKLIELPLDEFFVSIAPYRAGVGSTEATTMANKTFQLMAKGLPLVTYGMPHFLGHPAIFKAKSYEEFSDYLHAAQENFWPLQESIKKLIDENQSGARYETIMRIINKG